MISIERHTMIHLQAGILLEHIQKCRDIVLDNKFQLATFDQEKDWMKPIRLMHDRRDFIDRIERYTTLEAWLQIRYTNLLTHLNSLMAQHIIESLPQNLN